MHRPPSQGGAFAVTATVADHVRLNMTLTKKQKHRRIFWTYYSWKFEYEIDDCRQEVTLKLATFIKTKAYMQDDPCLPMLCVLEPFLPSWLGATLPSASVCARLAGGGV